MSYVIMTAKEWVRRMKKLASGRSTYRNEFPWNLLYYVAAENRFYGDCSNTQKALFNGRDVDNPTNGSYAWPLPATGDATEYALLMQCTDIGCDFTKLKIGEPRLLYKEGHIGAYLGEEWEEPGQGTVNCVECTPAWEDGIQFSYVDAYGGRYWAKGQSQRGSWTHHGLASKWVEYTEKETQAIIEKDKAEVAPEVHTQHYNTTDLAVMIIRNKFGVGQARKENLYALGYTEDERSSAQALVNKIVKNANNAKAEAEKQYVISVGAYDLIAGKYGDGATRKTALTAEFGEEYAALIQAKAEEYIFN